MAKFLIEPHFRLQEWVAEEKDYFRKEGLEYEFRELMRATDGKIHDKGDKVGAYQSFEEGRKSNVSCACHWTVNVAASNGHGKMYTDVYSVAPAGVFVAADSKIKDPADLAGVPVSVGYQSGSHYSTSRRWSSISSPSRSTSSMPTACCSSAWKNCSTARRRPSTCSAGLITSPSSSASGR